MSGNFTLFAELHGKFFTDEQEPQSWDDNFSNMYTNYFNGTKAPIKELDYYYNKEKKSHKKLKNLDEVLSFINEDPHIGNKQMFIDVTKNKPKIVTITNLKNREINDTLPKAIKEPERTKKRKKKIKMKIVKIKRIKN